MAGEKGVWIETATHNKFYILNPTRKLIQIEDVASHLSHISRFGGAVQERYSVAEHSIHCSRLCRKGAKIPGLMHDAHEALIGADLVRPLKLAINHLAGKDLIGELVGPIDRALEKDFDFSFEKSKAEVTGYDNALLEVEAKVIMRTPMLPEWKLQETGVYKIEEEAFRSMRIEFLKAPNYEEFCRDTFLEIFERHRYE